LEFTYTIKDTLGLAKNKLEIFRITDNDSVLVASYSDLPLGEGKEFQDQIDNKKGWSGIGSDQKFVQAGNYRFVLTSAVDEAFRNGFTDYEEIIALKSKPSPIESITTNALEATAIGTKYTGNETSPACNICVRSVLYLIKTDSALFPTTGSGYNDPINNYVLRYIKGYVTHNGQAKKIKEDFDTLSNTPKLDERFEEIKKITEEGWEDYFLRLQSKADLGEIVIGVMLNSTGASGHIVMITPGGLINIETKSEDEFIPDWGFSFTNREIFNIPRILECGNDAREFEAPFCRNIDFKGATQRLKWFNYLK